ncbi:MAG: hypothetical protein AAF787_07440 [Chloroflexota bacterium]
MKCRALLIALLVALLPGVAAAQNIRYFEMTPLAVSVDGRTLAISGYLTDGSGTSGMYVIQMVDSMTGEQLMQIEVDETHPVEGLALSSDGRLIAYNTANGDLSVINTVSQEKRTFMEGGFAEIGYLRFNSDDRLFAYFFGNTILVLDRAQNRQRLNLSDSIHASIIGMDWHPTEDQLAVLEYDSESEMISILLWEISPTWQTKLMNRYEVSATNSIRWSPDGNSMATNTFGGVVVTDVATGEQHTLHAIDTESPVQSIAWNPDGHQIAGGGDGIISIWDVETGEIVETIAAEDSVWDVYWAPNGEYIYHTGGDAGIYRNGVPLKQAIIVESVNP